MVDPVVLVGHPCAPIGMGELLRSTFRSLRAVGEDVRVLDVYGGRQDSDFYLEFKEFMVDRAGDGVNVFCINGDEVAPILAHLGERGEGGRRRVVYPAWELPNYPAEWARQLERFDEAWAASAYIAQAIAPAIKREVHVVPLATDIRAVRARGRRSFGIPDEAVAFLSLFDLSSYIDRKNPFGALEAFRRMRASGAGGNAKFVVKMNSSHAKPADRRRFLDFLAPFGDQVIVIDQTFPDADVKALHHCVDVFVSLHRAEGYGFGIAEAMFLGKPAVATGYSGNMEFMREDNSFPIASRLIAVPRDAYPFWQGQEWADPDLDHAAAAMARLAEDRALREEVGRRASEHIRRHFSFRATGLKIAERLRAPAG